MPIVWMDKIVLYSDLARKQKENMEIGNYSKLQLPTQGLGTKGRNETWKKQGDQGDGGQTSVCLMFAATKGMQEIL